MPNPPIPTHNPSISMLLPAKILEEASSTMEEAGLRLRRVCGSPVVAEGEPQSGRRAMLGLFTTGVAGIAFVNIMLAEPKPIKIGPPPTTSGGLCHPSSHLWNQNLGSLQGYMLSSPSSQSLYVVRKF